MQEYMLYHHGEDVQMEAAPWAVVHCGVDGAVEVVVEVVVVSVRAAGGPPPPTSHTTHHTPLSAGSHPDAPSPRLALVYTEEVESICLLVCQSLLPARG